MTQRSGRGVRPQIIEGVRQGGASTPRRLGEQRLERLTKLSEAILARRTTADSTSSTARSCNNARSIL